MLDRNSWQKQLRRPSAKKKRGRRLCQFGPWQHGFRSGRSISADMIFTLRRIIDVHWEHNKPLFIGFLDLKKAFDRVPRHHLWKPLGKHSLPQPRVRAIINLYSVNLNRVATGSEERELWFSIITTCFYPLPWFDNQRNSWTSTSNHHNGLHRWYFSSGNE